jgi:hypothetical protein
MQEHQHPQSGVIFKGVRLVKGAVLQEIDYYASTSGTWAPCACPGIVIKESHTMWVRPRELSEHSRQLLRHLITSSWSSVTRRSKYSEWVRVPESRFNWDPRVETPAVAYPGCLQELVDYGFLSVEVGDNPIYTLTDAGKQAAQEFLFAKKPAG